MTDAALTDTTAPLKVYSSHGSPKVVGKTRQAIQKRRKPRGLTRRIRKAVDAMVWHAMTRADAAAHAGLTEDALRQALRKPEVMAYLNEQLDVLRSGERPRAFHKLVKMAHDEKISDRTQFEAARYIDGQEQEIRKHQRGMQVTVNVGQPPGYMVDITAQQAEAAQILRQSGSVANVLEAKEVVPTEGVGTREGEADAER